VKPPGNAKELARAAGVRGAFVRAHGDEVLALVREILEKSRRGELKPEQEQKGPKDPNRRKREEALKAWRAEKAGARKVTPSVVLPNPISDTLASRPPANLEELRAVPYIGEKRVQLYGEELLALLAQYPVQG
jgi:ribonuclease D